ncbi:hypothetical protein ABZP36_014105 [Zizania latifolia]
MKNMSLFSYPPPQSSPCCGTTDGAKRILPCDHRPAIEEIVKEQSLVTQLRAVVLPALETKADERAELVAQLFGSILDCSRKVICALKSHSAGELPEADIDIKRRVKRKNDDVEDKMKGEDAKGKTHEQKRRRHTNSKSHVTLVPHYDGHQWRKYGQKNINNSNHQRSYYRCTYKHEQNCKATKTVQQLDSAGETMMYTVVYYGQHTCKSNTNHDSSLHVIETSTPQSLSTTTCSDPGDYGQTLGNMHTPELAGVCSDLGSHHTLETDQDNNTLGLAYEDMHELLDIFACGPLDLEIWENDAIVAGSAGLC